MQFLRGGRVGAKPSRGADGVGQGDLLASSLGTATFDGDTWRDAGSGSGSTEGQYVDWLTIAHRADSVAAHVGGIRNHPLVPGTIPIYGIVYDVAAGALVEVSGRLQRVSPADRPTAPPRIA